MSADPRDLSYAETVVRASAMTGHGTTPIEREKVEEAQRFLAEQGYETDFVRFLDDAGARWRLVLYTPRGPIPILLERPSDWREALQERGLL